MKHIVTGKFVVLRSVSTLVATDRLLGGAPLRLSAVVRRDDGIPSGGYHELFLGRADGNGHAPRGLRTNAAHCKVLTDPCPLGMARVLVDAQSGLDSSTVAD